jgi:arylsulfatase A-like enzyme
MTTLRSQRGFSYRVFFFFMKLPYRTVAAVLLSGLVAAACKPMENSGSGAPVLIWERVPRFDGSVRPDGIEALRAQGYLAARVTLGHETRPALIPPLSSPRTIAVEPSAPRSFRFAIAATSLPDGHPGVRFRLSLGGAKLFDETIPASRQGKWLERRIALVPSPSRAGLTFETWPLADAKGALALWGTPVIESEPRTRERPTLILISVDCLRADHVGVYGYAKPTTPSIDEVAKEATVFRRASSASSWTIPSHTSMFTGLPPLLHGVSESQDRYWAGTAKRLAPSIPYLAEILARRGYRTAGAVSSVAMSQVYGFERGFGVYRLHPANAAQVVDSALDLASRARDREQFLFIHFIDAHWPYLPMVEFPKYAREFLDRFPPRPKDISELTRRLSGKADRARPEDAAEARSLYDAAIAYVDRELGRFFLELRRMGLYENSLILVTSDHGESFHDHGTWGHGRNLYEELTHVPLVVKWPRSALRGDVHSPVSHLDFFPTLLEAAGIAPPPNEGVSLRAMAAGSGDASSARAMVMDVSWEDRFRRETMVSVRRGARKYVAVFPYGSPEEISWSSLLREELYDVESDPLEKRNLAAELKAEMDPFRERARAYLEAARVFRSRHRGEGIEIDEETERSLESLGYVSR